jgi:hypothetical protein
MKKIVAMVVLALCVAGVVGCGSAPTTAPAAKTSAK